MSASGKYITREFFLKNVLTDCCTRIIELEFEKLNVEVESKRLGQFRFRFDPDRISWEELKGKLEELGFKPLQNREARIVEEIKAAIIKLIHYSTYNAMVRNSDFLVEKFDMSYQHISTIFKKHEKITLEKYIILQKIEKVKGLLEDDELTLSEIAFAMGYSSVQYLSTQFKNVTGVSVSDYKRNPGRKDILEL
ncbi:MAG: AraC family transcriptional regulator [Bacteroidales bacterium]|nr:AraC family transcriptional regulator [Bacteroidales bacterium]MCF8386464.1 AraC family transcriptional regulator [Bacteroidales bacterium]MCF8397792.1 AraC family transcriptional regulator [Bacteroidales bacterium]